MQVRKIVTIVEDVRVEGGRPVQTEYRVAVVAAVIENPWKGLGFVEDLAAGIDANASELGALLAPRVVEALGAPIEAYGKAAIVGLDGEIEHGSALVHTLKFGDHFRRAAQASTLLPAVEKRAAAGTVFDIPLKHITDATIRSHHQTVEVRISDAPHADEIIVALAGASSGRPQQRLAALSTETTAPAAPPAESPAAPTENVYAKPMQEQELRADLEEIWQGESPATARRTDFADEVDGRLGTRHRLPGE